MMNMTNDKKHITTIDVNDGGYVDGIMTVNDVKTTLANGTVTTSNITFDFTDTPIDTVMQWALRSLVIAVQRTVRNNNDTQTERTIVVRDVAVKRQTTPVQKTLSAFAKLSPEQQRELLELLQQQTNG